MHLTDLKVRTAKPKDKPYKISDGDGLYLLVKPTGKKYWRMKYSVEGKEKLLAFGKYPDLSLADARDMRAEARKLKAKGMDPGEVKRKQKAQILINSENCFEKLAREWHNIQASKWSPYYAKQVMQRLEKDVFPKIGHKAMDSITARELLNMATAIQDRDAIEMAHRAVNICGQVFQYALITERAENNPALALRGALKAPKTNNYAYLSAKELPGFLAALKAYNAGSYQTKLAIQFLMLTFVRTNELCGARWAEIDMEKAEWRIPAERMKMKAPHIVPLSTQAVAVLKKLHSLSSHREHVFPSIQSPRKTMSTNTMLQAIYAMGYKDRTTGHGFRATASTIINESGLFSPDVIERQLAHQERNKVRASYNHADYMPERRKMMQWWASYLDNCAEGASNVVKVSFVREQS